MDSIITKEFENWLSNLPVGSETAKTINQIEREAINKAGITKEQYIILEEAYNRILLIAQEKAYKDGFKQACA